MELIPVLLSLNIITLILTYLAYHRNKNDFNTSSIFNFNFKLGAKCVITPTFSCFVPIPGGSWNLSYEHSSVNNIIILSMLFLIPAYLVVVAYLKDRIHPITYPYRPFYDRYWTDFNALSLTSFNILGRDVHQEFYVFQLTLSNFHWNINDFYNPYNACLSISILPTIYYVLTNLNPEYIFKLLFALLGSILPLMVFTVAKKYLDIQICLLCIVIICVSGLFYQYCWCCKTGNCHNLLLFSGDGTFWYIWNYQIWRIHGLKKYYSLPILVFSMIISHYTTSYVAFVVLVPILLLPFFKEFIY